MERSRKVGLTQKLRILNNIRKMCVRMDKGRLPIVLKALEAIEDAEPEVATTLFKALHATRTTKVTIEVSPVKRTRTENTVIAQPPAAATTVTTTFTPSKPKQMQADSSIRRLPQRRRLLGHSELMRMLSLMNKNRPTRLK